MESLFNKAAGKPFKIIFKPNSHLMSISRRGPVTPSTSTFFQYQSYTKKLKSYFLFEKSLRNDCNNFCLHPKPFKMISKSNSYLMSISRHGPVNPSIHTFPNINITKTNKNLLVISKITEKWLQ